MPHKIAHFKTSLGDKMSQDKNSRIVVSASAIWFGALIGIGFCIMLGSFGGAVASSMNFDDAMLLNNGILIGAGCVVLLACAFFLAGFIASKIAHQHFVFDAIVHSLGSWAIMAILLITMVSVVVMSENLRKTFSRMKAPAIITDVHVFKAKAVTTIKGSEEKADAESSKEDEQSDKMLRLVWWIVFSSLFLGSGASIAGGLWGRSGQEVSRP